MDVKHIMHLILNRILTDTVYEQPISMPVGYHRLNVILVAANGKTSKMTAMEYYLQY